MRPAMTGNPVAHMLFVSIVTHGCSHFLIPRDFFPAFGSVFLSTPWARLYRLCAGLRSLRPIFFTLATNQPPFVPRCNA